MTFPASLYPSYNQHLHTAPNLDQDEHITPTGERLDKYSVVYQTTSYLVANPKFYTRNTLAKRKKVMPTSTQYALCYDTCLHNVSNNIILAIQSSAPSLIQLLCNKAKGKNMFFSN